MKQSHKILYVIGVLIFGCSFGILAYGASPEAQTIIDNANTLDQTISTQQTTITDLQAQVTTATQPQTNYFSSDTQAVITVNGIDIQALPCNDASIPPEWQNTHAFCFVLTR